MKQYQERRTNALKIKKRKTYFFDSQRFQKTIPTNKAQEVENKIHTCQATMSLPHSFVGPQTEMGSRLLPLFSNKEPLLILRGDHMKKLDFH